MAVELKCAEEGHADKRWILHVNGPVAILATPDEQVVARFPQADALKRFKLPGLADDTKHFSIQFDEQVVKFHVAPAELSQIEDFLNRQSAQPLRAIAPVSSAPAMIDGVVPDESMDGPRASPHVKIFFGLLATVYTMWQGVSLIGSLKHGSRSPAFLSGQIVGVIIGALVAFLFFRRAMRARPSSVEESADLQG